MTSYQQIAWRLKPVRLDVTVIASPVSEFSAALNFILISRDFEYSWDLVVRRLTAKWIEDKEWQYYCPCASEINFVFMGKLSIDKCETTTKQKRYKTQQSTTVRYIILLGHPISPINVNTPLSNTQINATIDAFAIPTKNKYYIFRFFFELETHTVIIHHYDSSNTHSER